MISPQSFLKDFEKNPASCTLSLVPGSTCRFPFLLPSPQLHHPGFRTDSRITGMGRRSFTAPLGKQSCGWIKSSLKTCRKVTEGSCFIYHGHLRKDGCQDEAQMNSTYSRYIESKQQFSTVSVNPPKEKHQVVPRQNLCPKCFPFRCYPGPWLVFQHHHHDHLRSEFGGSMEMDHGKTTEWNGPVSCKPRNETPWVGRESLTLRSQVKN